MLLYESNQINSVQSQFMSPSCLCVSVSVCVCQCLCPPFLLASLHLVSPCVGRLSDQQCSALRGGRGEAVEETRLRGIQVKEEQCGRQRLEIKQLEIKGKVVLLDTVPEIWFIFLFNKPPLRSFALS